MLDLLRKTLAVFKEHFFSKKVSFVCLTNGKKITIYGKTSIDLSKDFQIIRIKHKKGELVLKFSEFAYVEKFNSDLAEEPSVRLLKGGLHGY